MYPRNNPGVSPGYPRGNSGVSPDDPRAIPGLTPGYPQGMPRVVQEYVTLWGIPGASPGHYRGITDTSPLQPHYSPINSPLLPRHFPITSPLLPSNGTITSPLLHVTAGRIDQVATWSGVALRPLRISLSEAVLLRPLWKACIDFYLLFMFTCYVVYSWLFRGMLDARGT